MIACVPTLDVALVAFVENEGREWRLDQLPWPVTSDEAATEGAFVMAGIQQHYGDEMETQVNALSMAWARGVLSTGLTFADTEGFEEEGAVDGIECALCAGVFTREQLRVCLEWAHAPPTAVCIPCGDAWVASYGQHPDDAAANDA
ncbi:MAG: hypothetical protein GY937_22945 [bacterium]|nr:hypothetical protein [bacterium]